MSNICCNCDCGACDELQRHVHAIIGNTFIAQAEEDPHNHFFAVVSGEAEAIPGGHVHRVSTRTDFYEEHFHLICGVSSPAIEVGDRHVHYVKAETTTEDGHQHEFRFVSLLNDPIGDE